MCLGAIFVCWVVFGVSWWVFPTAFVLGAASSLVLATPHKELKAKQEQLQLQEESLDKELKNT